MGNCLIKFMGCCNQNIVKTVAHGAMGLAKVALHIDYVSPEVRKQRIEVCMACPHSTKKTVNGKVYVRFCELCKCWIAAKSTLKSELCCGDRWLSLNE